MLSKSINYINVSSPFWENKSEHRKKISTIQRTKLLWHRTMVFPCMFFRFSLHLELTYKRLSENALLLCKTQYSKCLIETAIRMQCVSNVFENFSNSPSAFLVEIPVRSMSSWIKFNLEHISRLIDKTWLCDTSNLILLRILRFSSLFCDAKIKILIQIAADNGEKKEDKDEKCWAQPNSIRAIVRTHMHKLIGSHSVFGASSVLRVTIEF